MSASARDCKDTCPGITSPEGGRSAIREAVETTYYAHSTDKTDRSDWHRLSDHLREVGRLAALRGSPFGAGRAAALAGWLHDLGKYSAAFQRRLAGSREQVDHSTAGAREVIQLATGAKDKFVAELIAYAIAGHHAGLADRYGESGSLSDRLSPQNEIEPLDPVWKTELPFSPDNIFPAGFKPDRERPMLAFQLAFLGRMIFSCLVDADFRDTELFYARIRGEQVDREWPDLQSSLEHLAARFAHYMEMVRRRAAGLPELNRLRDDIHEHVCSKVALPAGVFTLNVPTGGGKTLVSLAFALGHAKAHGLRRIITAIPFTSVIDQTASIFREVLGGEFVLEHHSAIDEERNHRREGADKLRLAMEDWAAPIVVTTNVQLFESLFSDRPSRCRKLHNIANSVIILDEAQTIPLHVLRPCVAALKELARNYGCTIVLCTATQPALDAQHVKWGFELDPDRELAPDPDELHRTLRRTTLVRRSEPLSDADLVEALKPTERGLVIVNSRKHALDLYRAVRDAGLSGAIHLSTRQTAHDRRAVLATIKARLTDRQPCRLIATSLVEAGIDLDFPLVWRAEAGLDQIVQAAGRCNREGKNPRNESIVTIFRPADAKPPAEIRAFAEDFARMADSHAEWLSPAAIRDYFEEVYWRKGDGLDKIGIFPTATKREGSFQMSSGSAIFDYRTVGQSFRLIESGMLPIVIATDDHSRRALEGMRAGYLKPGAAARELQNYIVQVPPKDRAKLIDGGHAQFVDCETKQFVQLVNDNLYSREIGLLWETDGYLPIDNLII